jgi:hypothetical protein
MTTPNSLTVFAIQIEDQDRSYPAIWIAPDLDTAKRWRDELRDALDAGDNNPDRDISVIELPLASEIDSIIQAIRHGDPEMWEAAGGIVE